jgi:hypothetical protein
MEKRQHGSAGQALALTVIDNTAETAKYLVEGAA